jgi:hypothetical protein
LFDSGLIQQRLFIGGISVRYVKLPMIGAAFLLLTGAARADVAYSYTSDSGTNNGDGTITYQVFLTETLTGSSTSIISAKNGLFGAGVAFDVTSGNATIKSASLNTSTLTSSSPGQGFGTGGTGNGNTTRIEAAGSTNGNVANGVLIENIGPSQSNGVFPTGSSTSGTTTTNVILLGTFTVTQGSAASVITVNALINSADSQFGGGAGNTVTKTNNYDLDLDDNNGLLATGTYFGASDVANTISVAAASATPEPSSFLLCGLAFGGMGYGAYRRRKAKAEAAKVEDAPVVVAA